ncbi:PREDICTED: prenylcysteine oxidase 1 [Pygoscelis adeliae]|uniref:prenylcysteine oxidase 1 n=1 Tax=Pygoscelis adeliae TaxID=9238 RepID=UPI0004F4DA4E|nr:PREDICTED: prenylcysteine oxidase 1 [Pygoscelis adeliae]
MKRLSVAPARGSLVGIYNGEEFVFEESGWYLVNLLKLLWHYGLNPLRMYMWVEDVLDKFMRYVGPPAREEVGERLQEKEEGRDKCWRLRTGVESGLWSVKGGNKLVCTGLIYASKADVIPATVLSIEPKIRPRPTGDPVKLYQVTYSTASGQTADTYDIVVIAAPLSRKMANITFKNFDPPVPEFPNPYHQTVTTLVHGRLNASFFGYRDPSAFHLGAIFTTENPKLFVNSLGVVSPVEDVGGEGKPPSPSAVWKVFSKEALTKEQLSLLFSSYDSVKAKSWLAYPRYSPPEKCPPVILHDKIYYLNGIERAASAVEMSAIAAKNAALLAYHRWYGNSDRIDQEDLHEKLKTEL